ncbi:HEAT repeat domain-containing protein [Calothrix sp. NIES-2098]|uniref:HEAT repeat domain-containing protein n=1 Tax=Calothrix sp. NIES-2098 TaxID=1954171 RepID=UPI000B6110F8|nr:hypothetical protein NIES2098_19180 [Calothrix sp. NIES-2098]
MKLIKRTTLHYQEGRSTRVYEVDLCQITDDLYVVNFRYGKQGANLKESTKTTQAVSLAEAQKIFNNLVKQKTQKGYTEVNLAPRNQPLENQLVSHADPRKQAILDRLANKQPSKWKLERAIWRAGELKIREATPLLIKLIGTGEPLRDYCLAWALGWCGDNQAIQVVTQLYQNPTTPDFVKRIAFEALLKLVDAETKTRLQIQKISSLPPELQPLAQSGSSDAFAIALHTYLDRGNYQNFAVLDTIYQIDNAYVRPVLINILRSAPFLPNYFQRIRHIFKIAEYRHDAEIFAILAYRFDKQKAMFSSRRYTINLSDEQYLRKPGLYWHKETKNYFEIIENEIERELKLPDAKIAYSTKTRNYFLRRVWRTLKNSGEERDADYINMAVEILLQYSDADAEAIKESVFKRRNPAGEQVTQYKRTWDAFGRYLIFNHILYENSPYYELKSNAQAWSCQEGYIPENIENLEIGTSEREEAFPQLWEQNQAALIELLMQSRCYPVHYFAVRALRSSLNYSDVLDIQTTIKLLQKPYLITVQFAFIVALIKYNSSEPNRELVIAMANCIYDNARAQAITWIDEQREYFLQDSNFFADLLVSQYSEIRKFARSLLNSYIIRDREAFTFINKIITKLLSIQAVSTSDSEYETAKELMAILLINFTPQLRSLQFSTIQELVAHPLPLIQELGARILLNHEIKAENLPPELIVNILISPHERIRVIGIRIFGLLPNEKLIGEYRCLIVAMAANASIDIRNAIKPIIQGLASNYPIFNIQLATDLIEVLLTSEKYEGVHGNLLSLLQEDLQGWMPSINKETTFKLLLAKSAFAQDLGSLLLRENYQALVLEIETSEIIKIANHEIFTVRETARHIFIEKLEHFRTDPQELLLATRLLESNWDDTREFTFRIFTQEFTADNFTPEILVSICDSVREDVRKLGRDLLTRNFKSEHGQEYLLKFSEHPSADMQLFASNFLSEYAVDNPVRLQELMPFFITVLSLVNRGSVSKKRIFAFLASEAQKSEAAAKIVAEIITRQSVTMVIGDKSAAIQLMLKIHKKFPHISLPFTLKAVTEIRT